MSVPAVATDESGYRRRLLDGMAQSIREVGLANTRIADVVRHARTSRRTFYEFFESRDECYMALLRERTLHQITTIAAAVNPVDDFEHQVSSAIQAWIDSAAQEPELMRSWIRELATLGDHARELQRELLDAFVAMVERLAESESAAAAGVSSPPRELVVMLIGGLRELVAVTVEDGGDFAALGKYAITATMQLAFAQLPAA
jgi:AcrR family transcriptional regulator